jgi:Protein of unknown function (DUF2786)
MHGTNSTESASSHQEKRTALLDKITALLAKTKANGCTESEAIAAAELAEKLMAKYGLSLSELSSISAPSEACEADGVPIGASRCHEVVRLGEPIACYTDTRHWYNSRGIIHVTNGKMRAHEHRGVLLIYFGLPSDVQVAIYLTTILRQAMETEWSNYWKLNRLTSLTSARTARANFMRGMASRISQRLGQMKREQAKASTNDCRSIVLVKEKIVTAAFEAAKIRIRAVGGRRPLADHGAFASGAIAGDRVTIAKGALPKN